MVKLTKKALLTQWKRIKKTLELTSELKSILTEYEKNCKNRNIPVIYNLTHFSLLTEIDYSAMKSMVNSSQSFYYEFKIPKRKGGLRQIDKPYPSLSLVQNWIKKNILDLQEAHFSAAAYVKGKSIMDNAKIHLNNECILKIDLKDFFTTIKLQRVIYLFLSCGYPRHIALYLALLCTKNKYLPQGASTSPVISNLVCRKLDNRLLKLCESWKFTYSRYADDITVSGKHIPLNFQNIVYSIVEEEGFVLNLEKTKLIRGSNKRKIVTGISISNSNLHLPKNTKRQWKTEIYTFIKNNVIGEEIENRKFQDLTFDQILGKVNFWLQVEPQCQFALKSLVTLQEMKKSKQSSAETRFND
jgi:RNA-directed DNA polymerase